MIDMKREVVVLAVSGVIKACRTKTVSPVIWHLGRY
jgi:hypothetical protein